MREMKEAQASEVLCCPLKMGKWQTLPGRGCTYPTAVSGSLRYREAWQEDLVCLLQGLLKIKAASVA